MHEGNRKFIEHLKEKYPEAFVGRVLELGSLDINGSVREFFNKATCYVGVDIVAGPCVDIVTPAMNTSFEFDEFDTLISFSMFEHDPTWEQSYRHNLQWLKSGGMIFLCWGAEGNCPHPPEPFAIVTVAQFNTVTAQLGCVEIIDQFFEPERFPCPGGDCLGCYDVIARRT